MYDLRLCGGVEGLWLLRVSPGNLDDLSFPGFISGVYSVPRYSGAMFVRVSPVSENRQRRFQVSYLHENDDKMIKTEIIQRS